MLLDYLSLFPIDLSGTATSEGSARGEAFVLIDLAGTATSEREAAGELHLWHPPAGRTTFFIDVREPVTHVRTGLAALTLEARGTVAVTIDQLAVLTRRRREEDELLLLV